MWLSTNSLAVGAVALGAVAGQQAVDGRIFGLRGGTETDQDAGYGKLPWYYHVITIP